ncbi:MAG TPA: Hpt domain-containing protein [Gemmatimonadaceae bacterium]
MPSIELLRFFLAEAREYLDTIEGLLPGDPEFEAASFIGAARALRGSATMARVPRIPEIALAMERIANGVRDGEIAWTGRLQELLAETVADLRRFVGHSANWTVEDDRGALDRIATLRTLLPAGTATPPAPSSAGTTPIFIALQAAAIAADLETFVGDSSNRALVDDLVNRLRGLRGIAGVADHPPLGEVTDAIERVLRELAPDAMASDAEVTMLRAAAAVLRKASTDLRTRGRFESGASEIDAFARAAAALAPSPVGGEGPIVRIEDLFYTDAGPHIVRRGPAPRRSAEARFREEVVARAEHLRRLVADVRSAGDALTRERVRRELREHLSRMEEFSRSYGAQQVAAVAADAAAQDAFPEDTLDAVDNLARILVTPGTSLGEMESRLAVGERRRWTPAGSPVTVTPLSNRAPAASPRSGRALREMISTSLTKLSSLEEMPLIEPVRADDDAVVPVESLFYQGQAALQRARELRDEMRASGSNDPEALQELYDLLDLARAQ